MFNNFQNQGYMNQNYGYPQPGVQYAQRPVAKMTQTLTPEQIKKLKNTGGTFDLQVSQTDMLKAICTHKENGNIVLVENNDGTVTCPICGATFTVMAVEQEQVQDATRVVFDVLQTIKTMYLDIPEDVATQYFQLLPLLEKMPKLYQIAMSNFNKYDNPNQFQNTGSPYGFNMLSAVTNPAYGMGMQPMMAPNMYQPQPFQQPYQPQQPMMGNNPFGYGYPQGAPGMMPMATEQTQPAEAKTDGDASQQQQVTTQKTFNV